MERQLKPWERLPVKVGLDYSRDSNWRVRLLTRKGAQRYADQVAREMNPKGFWNGVVCLPLHGEYWRISFAGQET